MTRRIVVVLVLLAATAHAATFVVPDDLEFLVQSDAVTVASPLTSYTRLTANGSVETVTTFSVEEVIKGSIEGEIFDLIEPGGVLEGHSWTIPGIPRFENGHRYLLFLSDSAGSWRVRDLALGKFSFATDVEGRDVLVRDEDQIAGWDPDGKPHVEPRRGASLFLAFLRKASRGHTPIRDYPVPRDPILAPSRTIGSLASVAPLAAMLSPAPTAVYSATSYTFVVSGALGARWNRFPSPVSFYAVGTEPGAPGGGSTAINAAFAAWNNDPNSNVNYAYAGQDLSGAHNGGLTTSDGQNTIAFEQDLSAYGVGPFQCSGNSFSGTLGIGGVTSAGGTHTGPNGEAFLTTLEGDVQMNKGIANCSLLFNNGDFNSAVAHEVGHTLGFRHSDQTRADNPSVVCTTDASLECSSAAIMKAFIPNGLNATLQPWDQHAVDALYPGSGAAPSSPTGFSARATATNSVLLTWTAASGATSYDVYRRGPGAAYAKVGSTTATSFTDSSVAATTAYLYFVRAINGSGSADSAADLATTILFTDDPLTPGVTVIKSVHLAELRTAVNAVRSLAGLAAASFTGSPSSGLIVRAVHITELRSALDAALSALGLPAGGWTNTVTSGVVIRAVDFQELRNRVK